MPSAVSDPAPGSLRLASSARPVPARSPAGGRAGAAHPRLGCPFSARPICRAARALRRIPRGAWAERQPEFLGGNGDRGGNALTWILFASFPTQARPTYFLGVAQGKAFTHARDAEKKPKLSRSTARRPLARSPSAGFIFLLPCYFLSSFRPFSAQSPPPFASSEERRDWPAKGGSARSAKFSPPQPRLPVAEPWHQPVAWLR